MYMHSAAFTPLLMMLKSQHCPHVTRAASPEVSRAALPGHPFPPPLPVPAGWPRAGMTLSILHGLRAAAKRRQRHLPAIMLRLHVDANPCWRGSSTILLYDGRGSNGSRAEMIGSVS